MSFLSIALLSNKEIYAQNQFLAPAQMQKHLQKASGFEQTMPDSALYHYNLIIPENITSDEVYNAWLNTASHDQKYMSSVAMVHSGLIYLKQNNIEKGLQLIKHALETANNINNAELAKFSSDNLAVFYAQNQKFLKAIEYLEKSLEISRKLEDDDGIMFCLGNLGAIHANTGNLYGAAFYYEQLLNFQQTKGYKLEIADDIINIAMLYTRLEELNKAIRYWELALSTAENKMESKQLNLIYSNLAANYYKSGQYVHSLDYYLKSLETAKELNNQREVALAQNNIAILYYHLKDLERSAMAWEKALNIAMQTGQGQIVFDALINLSNIYNQTGDREKSINYYEQYLSLAMQVDDPVFAARSLLGMAEIQHKAGNMSKAREYYSEAQKAFKKIDDNNITAEINNLIANTYLEELSTNNAILLYFKNVDEQNYTDSLILAESYNGIGNSYRVLRQFEFSEIYLQKALDIYNKNDKPDKASAILNSLAYIQEINGNLPKAVSLYENALQLAEESGNRNAVAAIYNNLGVVYRQLGDLPRARNSYLKSMDIYQQTNNEDALAYCYNNLGIIYELSGDFVSASNFYEKSLQIKVNSDDLQGLATSFLNIGNIQRLQGRITQARDYYEQALEISEEINDFQGMAVVLANLAALYIETGEYYQTIGYANLSRQISEKEGFLSTLRESHRQLAWAYHAVDNLEKAEESYIKVISLIHEEIDRNFSILSESEKELFFNTVEEDFARFHSFALERIDSNPAITGHVYNNLLKNKGLLLKSSTAMRNAILNSQDESLIKTFDRWIQIKQEIAQLYTLPAEQRDTSAEVLEEQANDLERHLVRNSSEFSQFDESMNIDWISIKEKLDSNEVAIEFTNFTHLQDKHVYCALIIRNDLEYPILVTLFEEKEIEGIMGTFTGNNYQYINNIYGRLSQPQFRLYELIWMPLENYLDDISKVYLSASGLLHKVSFAAISNNIGQFISDNTDIFNLSTTANVLSLKDVNINEETGLALFGGIKYSVQTDNNTWSYLPGTLEEIEIIQNIVSDYVINTTTVYGAEATEEKFKLLAAEKNILHIATHGFFFPDPDMIDDLIDFDVQYEDVMFRGTTRSFGLNNFVRNTNPLMRSGLVCAGVNDYWTGEKKPTEDDGVLTALEVINIDLRNTELVIMSACETGLGEIKGSEGVYGLQRAFKMAGANQLIMSLWQVPDKETAEFMELFYTKLLDYKDVRIAFNETQREMRQKYDPFFWAAFVLVE